MEEKNERFALIISVVSILLVIAILIIVRLISPIDNPIAITVVAISHNLLSPLIIAVLMFWLVRKPLLKNQLLEEKFEVFNERTQQISNKLAVMSGNVEQALNQDTAQNWEKLNKLMEQKHQSTEQKLDEFNNNAEKVYEKLSVLSQNIEHLMNASSSFIWEEHSNVLEKLRGYWVQYIPERQDSRSDINTDCRFTLAQFDIDQFGKHVYRGTNYFSSGKPNYSFSSIKLLPPMDSNSHTKVFYYIYRRHGNQQYENKHGFGKIYAEREHDSDPTAYEFNKGFFFNEATKATSYQMYIRRAETVKNILGLHWDFESATEEQLGEFFQKLIEKNIAENWIEN